jgi:RHS repeat-associated protein
MNGKEPSTVPEGGAGRGRVVARRTGRVTVGHPVDAATGELFTAAHDVELGGVAPLVFRRFYSTSLLDEPPSVLGRGWTLAFDAYLTRDLDGFVFAGHDGQRIELDDFAGRFESGGSILNAGASMELRREGERLVVYHWHGAHEPVQKYVFDPRHGDRMPLMARLLPSGQGLELQRDRAGRLLSITQNTERRRLHLHYADTGRLQALSLGFAADGVNRAAPVARFRYGAGGMLIAVDDAAGAAQEYVYDDDGRLVLERGRRGGAYRMQYDRHGRCVETSGDDGYHRRQLSFEPGGRTRVRDSLGHETIYEYNNHGQVEREIRPDGAIHFTQFDDQGRIAVQVDPAGGVTRHAYDARGNLAETTHANGARFRYEYDDDHQPTRIVEPDGAEWRFGYELGALTAVTDPFHRQIRYRRGRDNQLIGAVTATGQEIRIQTNERFTEETISDGMGLVVRRQLDLRLNATRTEDASGAVDTVAYDAVGRLATWSRPDGSTRRFSRDPEGAVEQLVNGRGGVWRAQYASSGECLDQVDPLGRTHAFTWDSEGRLTSITNPARERAEFAYDAAGNLISIRHFDGREERARYDVAGRLIERRAPDGMTLSLERDEVGHLTGVRVGDVLHRRFVYDACGAITEAATPEHTTTFEYAPGGRLLAEVQNGRRIEYRFDERGLLSGRAFEGSRVGPLGFEHDARGRLARLFAEGGDCQRYEYDMVDRCAKRTLGKRTEARAFDLQGRLRHQEVSGVIARSYDHDAEGALVGVVDAIRGREEHRYDAADQLIASTGVMLGEHQYHYDVTGNLVERDSDRLTYGSGGALRQVGGTIVERDGNGQLTRLASAAGEGRSFAWDELGQLVRVEHDDGAQTRFGYDAFGRRTWKDHRAGDGAASQTRYFWSGDDLLADERGGRMTEYAMWGAVAQVIWEDGQIRHVVNSQQGVPQALLDGDGQTVWLGRFDEWGRLIAEEGSARCDLRLPGQIFDSETGLHYNRYRYYMPEAGQFISPDPIGFQGGPHAYRYAPNTTTWTDPLGLVCRPAGQHQTVLARDLSGGRHAADRPLQDVIGQAGQRAGPGHPRAGLPVPIGRWASPQAAEAAAARTCPALARQVVALDPGEGSVVHGQVQSYPPNPHAPTWLQVPADRALALPQPDGSMHIFPIDDTHYLYGPPGARP